MGREEGGVYIYYDIYIDSFFLSNFLMDYYVLLLVCKLLKCTATHVRLLLGAVFGAVCACLCLVFLDVPEVIRVIISYGFVGLFMLKISFRIHHFQTLFRALVYLYVVTFLYGGFFSFLNQLSPFVQQYELSLLSIISFGYFFCLIAITIIKKMNKSKLENIYQVTLTLGGKEHQVKALLDTGNSLTEPISQKPVSIIEFAILEPFILELEEKGMRVVPYHSVGMSNGLLKAYEFEVLNITNEECNITVKKEYIAVYDGILSAKGSYQMILHPDLIKVE